jgi:hypothetical protein
MDYLVNILQGLNSSSSRVISLSSFTGNASGVTVYNSQLRPNGDFSEICGQAAPVNARRPGDIRVTFETGMTKLAYSRVSQLIDFERCFNLFFFFSSSLFLSPGQLLAHWHRLRQLRFRLLVPVWHPVGMDPNEKQKPKQSCRK